MNVFRIYVTWDPAKAQVNESKLGVTFAEAAEALLDPLALTEFGTKHSTEEERWFTLGLTPRRRLLAVSHTYVSEFGETALVRIISAREATHGERHQYENEPL